MKPTREEVLNTIYESIEEVNELLPIENRLEKAPGTMLLGESSRLDSIGFVNLVALLEENLERRFNVSFSLISAIGHQEATNPFETVQKLAEHIVRNHTPEP